MKSTIKTMKKRVACGVLAVALAFGLMPAVASAGEKEEVASIYPTSSPVLQSEVAPDTLFTKVQSTSKLSLVDDADARHSNGLIIKFDKLKKYTKQIIKANKNYTLLANKKTTLAYGYSFYKFTLAKPGKLTIKSSGINKSTDLCLLGYDKVRKGAILLEWAFEDDKVTSYYLEAGTYYILAANSAKKANRFKIRLGYSKVKSSFADGIESKYNTMAKANKIGFNKTYFGVIGAHCSEYDTDAYDVYRFSVTKPGWVEYTFNTKSRAKDLHMGIAYGTGKAVEDSAADPGMTAGMYLSAGTYYLTMFNYWTPPNTGNKVAGGTYSFKVKFTPGYGYGVG